MFFFKTKKQLIRRIRDLEEQLKKKQDIIDTFDKRISVLEENHKTKTKGDYEERFEILHERMKEEK